MPWPYDDDDEQQPFAVRDPTSRWLPAMAQQAIERGQQGPPPQLQQQPQGFGQMPAPARRQLRPPQPVTPLGQGQGQQQQGGMDPAQMAAALQQMKERQTPTGTPPFVGGNPKPQGPGPQSARTPPFIAPSRTPPPETSTAGSPNYASPDVFSTPAELGQGNIQNRARTQGTAGVLPAPQSVTHPEMQADDTTRGRYAIDKQAYNQAVQSGQLPPPPPDTEGGRDRVVTEGGKQLERGGLSRFAHGALTGLMVGGARGGLPGAIAGGVTGGAISAASPQMARNIATEFIDRPGQDIRAARQQHDIAQAQANRKTEADIQGEEARTDQTRTQTGYAKGAQGRYEDEQRRLDTQDAREAQRLGLSIEEFHDRQAHEREMEGQGRVGLGLQISTAKAQYGPGGTKELTKDEHDRRDRQAELATMNQFTIGEHINLPQQYTGSAYDSMGGPAVDKEIGDLKKEGPKLGQQPAYDAKMRTLLQQKEKLTAEAGKRGQDTYKGQLGVWKNAYRQMIDENGGQMPDFGKKNKGQAYTQDQAAAIGKVYGLNPDQAVQAITKNGGRVLNAGETAPQSPVGAAPPAAPQQTGTTRQRQIPPPPNYGAPGFWQQYQ